MGISVLYRRDPLYVRDEVAFSRSPNSRASSPRHKTSHERRGFFSFEAASILETRSFTNQTECHGEGSGSQ